MGRKIIDVQPIITIQPNTGPSMTQAQAEELARELVEMAVGAFGRRYDVLETFEGRPACEHCNAPWTEPDPDYNGGCCDKDAAENPERLADLRELAEHVSDATFYDFDEGRRGHVAIDWAPTLADATLGWLDAGRPADLAAALPALIKRVNTREWCTVWEDPGPSGCSLARLPDEVRRDMRPEVLADELRCLLDEMGLLPNVRAA